MPPRHVCGTEHPAWDEYIARHPASFHTLAKQNATTDVFYIGTRYVVLYNNDDQKVSWERVSASHKGLNLVMAGLNTSDRAKMPNDTRYPWNDVVGTPNIQFSPLNPNYLVVYYLAISQSSVNDVFEAASLAGVVDGVLNVLIGNPTNDRLLGQAPDLGANYLFVNYQAMGSDEVPSILGSYNYKTLVHETGHALSLAHTFASPNCSTPVYPDVPTQINPNFDGTVFFDGTKWTGKLDNRYDDRINDTGRSCLSALGDPPANELFGSIMDYSTAANAILFTDSQANQMRSWLQSDSNNLLTVSLTAPVETTPSATVVYLNSLPTNDWPSGAIVLTVLLALGILVMLILFTYFYAFRPYHVSRVST